MKKKQLLFYAALATSLLLFALGNQALTFSVTDGGLAVVTGLVNAIGFAFAILARVSKNEKAVAFGIGVFVVSAVVLMVNSTLHPLLMGLAGLFNLIGLLEILWALKLNSQTETA